jgi:hypothetical protein
VKDLWRHQCTVLSSSFPSLTFGLATLLYASTAPKEVQIDLAWSCFDANKVRLQRGKNVKTSVSARGRGPRLVDLVCPSVTVSKRAKGFFSQMLSIGRIPTLIAPSCVQCRGPLTDKLRTPTPHTHTHSTRMECLYYHGARRIKAICLFFRAFMVLALEPM